MSLGRQSETLRLQLATEPAFVLILGEDDVLRCGFLAIKILRKCIRIDRVSTRSCGGRGQATNVIVLAAAMWNLSQSFAGDPQVMASRSSSSPPELAV